MTTRSSGLSPTTSLLSLNDGTAMPQLGLGLMRFGEQDTTGTAIHRAFEANYRLFDTASVYKTEKQTGEALRSLDCDRGEIFLTTKLWNTAQGRDKTRSAFQDSLDLLGLDYLDLYLIHWPCPKQGLYLETWQALIALKNDGLVRSIGVSNFEIVHLRRLIDETGIIPSVNQVEAHAYFQQRELRAFHEQHGIVTQAWSPFGGGGKGKTGALLEDPVITGIARKHGRAASEVLLRWNVAAGMSVIPKATSAAHLATNMNALTLDLDESDLMAIAALDRADGRFGSDPKDVEPRLL